MACNLKNSLKIINLVNSTVQYYVNEQCVRDNECDAYSRVGLTKPIFHIEYTEGKLTGQQSGIVHGSNKEPTEGEGDSDSDDEKPRKSAWGGFGGRGGGQQSGAAKWSGKSNAGKSGGGRPKSGGLFSGFFGKMRGNGRRLSRRAEQAEQVDSGNKGEHKSGQAWYCPTINGMSSILGHEGLEGEIQTCGGLVHRTRTIR
jgi:Glycoside-hydrolase family GH114